MYSIMELLMGCLQHDKFVVLDTRPFECEAYREVLFHFIPFYSIKNTQTDDSNYVTSSAKRIEKLYKNSTFFYKNTQTNV